MVRRNYAYSLRSPSIPYTAAACAISFVVSCLIANVIYIHLGRFRQNESTQTWLIFCFNINLLVRLCVCVCMNFIYFVFIRHIRCCVIRIPYIHSILSTFTFNRWIGVHRFGECSKIENWLHATQRYKLKLAYYSRRSTLYIYIV